MRQRWPRELIIGIGIGLIIAASFTILFDNITNAEIERRARELGMVDNTEILTGGPHVTLLLAEPTGIAAVAAVLQEGGVIADKQALIDAAAASQVTTVAAGTYAFDGQLAADATLTKLTGGGGK